MRDLTAQVQTILEQAPARAMALSRLLQALGESGVAVSERKDWFLKRLAEQSEVFQVIPDRLGPWVGWPEKARPGLPAVLRKEWLPDPWVMARSDPGPIEGGRGPLEGRIQESLHAWGRDLDTGSQVAVARWIQATREAEKALERVTTGGVKTA